MFPTILKSEKFHEFGNALSRATQSSEFVNINNAEEPFIQFDTVIDDCTRDQMFGPDLIALHDRWPDNPKEKFKLKQLLPIFISNEM